jgi:hypothetical protein
MNFIATAIWHSVRIRAPILLIGALMFCGIAGSLVVVYVQNKSATPMVQPSGGIADWFQEPFLQPAIQRTETGMVITGHGGSAGYFFRKPLDAAKTYKLTVRGRAVSNAATMRLRLGREQPTWLPAPDGEVEFVVARQPSVEALFYADNDFTYQLDGLWIDLCPDCKTVKDKISIVAAVAPQWTVSLFNEPEIQQDAGGATIGSKGTTAGVMFRRPLDPTRTYQLNIVGQQLASATTLRIRLGDTEPQWNVAPNGTSTFVVSRQSSVELLFYSDRTFAYQLTSLSIRECDQCQAGPDDALDLGNALAPGWTDSDWTITPFNNPIIRHRGTDVTISSDGKPAGIFYRRILDPQRKYRVNVLGRSISSIATLRTRTGQAEPQYNVAPDGKMEFVISGAPSLELLIYADNPFEYRVDSVSIEFCDICKSKTDRIALLAAAEPGWTAELFNNPELEMDRNGLGIVGDGQPAGITLKRPLDPNKTYRLKVTGRSTINSATLRLHFGNDDPNWLKAPEGTEEFTISRQSSVEIIIYQDSRFRYVLQNLELDVCPTCPTDMDLKTLILSKIPGLMDVVKSDQLKAARMIMNWSSQVSSLGDPSDPRVERNTFLASGMSASQIYYEIWDMDSGGAACSAFATFLSKVLHLFDIDAFTINIGYYNTDLTHVTTVVRIDDRDQPKFFIFDPTFNGEYRDVDDGSPIDVGEILKRDREQRYSSYRFDRREVHRTIFLENGRGSRLMKADRNLDCGPSDLNNMIICRDFDYTPEFLVGGWRPAMIQNNVSLDRDLIIQLMHARLFGVSGGETDRKAFNSLGQQYGIPIGYP